MAESREVAVEGALNATEGEEEVLMEAEARNDQVIQEGQKILMEKEELVRQGML